LFVFSNYAKLQENNLPKVYFSFKNYLHPDQGEYAETQLLFDAQSFDFHITDTGNYAAFEVTQLFKQNDHIVAYDKSRVNAVLIEDQLKKNFYFIEKFILPPGKYDYEMIIKDEFGVLNDLTFNKKIEVTNRSNAPNFSSITLARFYEKSTQEKPTIFTKFGYDIIPSFHLFYPDFINELTYYSELYNLKDFQNDSVFVLQESIYNKKEDSVYYNRYSRFQATSFYPILKIIDIADLPSGEYELKLAIINREKKVICDQSASFKRKNQPKLNVENIEETELTSDFLHSIPSDSSAYYVSSLIPIAGQTEVKNIIRLLSLKDDRINMKYLQAFWTSVDEEAPLESCILYKNQVDRVEANFGTNFQMGHETDRGRIFLKYGYPTQIYDIPSSPSEYPYEIWQYDKIQSFTNRRFIFYNTTNLNNDYRLLHSNMVGEIQNRRWRLEINKRNAFDNDLDSDTGTRNRQHWGQNSDLYYNSY
jgi:GWxTD domain-containing protein